MRTWLIPSVRFFVCPSPRCAFAFSGALISTAICVCSQFYSCRVIAQSSSLLLHSAYFSSAHFFKPHLLFQLDSSATKHICRISRPLLSRLDDRSPFLILSFLTLPKNITFGDNPYWTSGHPSLSSLLMVAQHFRNFYNGSFAVHIVNLFVRHIHWTILPKRISYHRFKVEHFKPCILFSLHVSLLQGWFSPGQVFVLDEYCARYMVRGCHRYVSLLNDLLNKADEGHLIDPTLMHYSFAFCASHVHGNRFTESIQRKKFPKPVSHTPSITTHPSITILVTCSIRRGAGEFHILY